MARYSKEKRCLLAELETEGTKLCNNCEEVKPLEEFTPDVRGRKGRQSWCKSCRNWMKKNKYDPNYKLNYDLKSKYGITLADYDDILRSQDGLCAICKTDTPDHSGRFVVDHCHSTGAVRALLCSKCNVMIGMAREDVFILLSAVQYLNDHKED